jgi:hypothetical protein
MTFAQLFKKVYKTLLPESVLLYKEALQNKVQYGAFHKRVLDYLQSCENNGTLTAEQKEAFDFLQNDSLQQFPYPFIKKYKRQDIKILKDADLGLHYVMLDGKRLYWKKEMTTFDMKRATAAILLEQDKDSPHCYISDDFKVEPNSVIVDIGAAEGIFALQNIGRAKKIYLIEADKQWVKPLEATFAPWKDKVEIICRYAGNADDKSTVSVDALYAKDPEINFLKIDVEGSEDKVLQGAKQLIQNSRKLKIAICTYHLQGDAEKFSSLLSRMNFKISFSRGFMLPYYGGSKQEEPYLRKAVLRAEMVKP